MLLSPFALRKCVSLAHFCGAKGDTCGRARPFARWISILSEGLAQPQKSSSVVRPQSTKASGRQKTTRPGHRVARPKRLARLAMGVGSVANDSSDSPRPSYLRACHPIYIPQSVPPNLYTLERATQFIGKFQTAPRLTHTHTRRVNGFTA